MKNLIQVLLIVIVLLVAFKLLFLIPSPTEMLKGTTIGFVFLPLNIALYVALAGFLSIYTWNLITFILRNEEEKKSNNFNKSFYSNYRDKPNISKQNKIPLTQVDREKNKTRVTINRQKFSQNKKNSLISKTLKYSVLIVGISFLFGFGIFFFFIYILRT